ncbi:Fc receptor-like protein 5 [Mustelus asterias]
MIDTQEGGKEVKDHRCFHCDKVGHKKSKCWWLKKGTGKKHMGKDAEPVGLVKTVMKILREVEELKWSAQPRHELDRKVIPDLHFTCLGKGYSGRAGEIDRPKSPLIVMNNQFAILIKGEFAKFTCAVSSAYSCHQMYLHRNAEIMHRASVQSDANYRFANFVIVSTVSANFTCVCETRVLDQLLKSEHSDLISIDVIDRPPKPSIRLNESESIFLKGETISIICETGVQSASSQVHLYQGSDGHSVCQQNNNSGSNVVSFRLVARKTEDYWCADQTAIQGRLIVSENSTAMRLPVIAHPLKPTCLLEAQGPATDNDQNVTVNCTVPKSHTSVKFHFYVNSQKQPNLSQVTDGQSFATIQLTVPRLQNRTQYYTCRYELKIAGRTLESEACNPQRLVLSDRPKSPLIVMNNQFAILIKGEFAKFTCAVSSAYSCHQMYLHRNAEIMHRASVQSDANYRFANFVIVSTVSANFTCVCETRVLDQLLKSEHSDLISIDVIDRPPKPSIRLNESESIFLKGETISIICETGVQSASSQVHLYQGSDGHSVCQQNNNSGSNVVSFRLVARKTEDYWCADQTAIQGRLIVSENSTAMRLPVIAHPLKPICLLEAQGPATDNDQNVTVNCTVPKSHTSVKFHFYVNSQKQPNLSQVTDGQSFATIQLTVPRLQNRTQYYTCRYELKIAGRTLESEACNPQRLVLSGGMNRYFLLVMGSPILLLLLIIVSICSMMIIKNVQSNNSGRRSSRGQSSPLEQDNWNVTPGYSSIGWSLTTVPENFGHTYDMVDLTDLNTASLGRWRREPSLYATIK